MATDRGVTLVHGERQEDYGHPFVNFTRIAEFWTVRLRDKLKPGEEIRPNEAASMMRLLKEARLMQTAGHEDTMDDLAGYVEVERLILEEEARRAS